MKTQDLEFNRTQITEILKTEAEKSNGLNSIMQMVLEALMKAERTEHNLNNHDVSNGFRSRKVFGHGKILELSVPRSRYNSFYPKLLTILKDQEEECKQLAFSLYGSGLTGEEVGKIFEELYGRHYDKSSVSRMMAFAREEVQAWLERPLEPYYPLVFIDATYIPTRRGDEVSKEAYYTVLAVRPDRTREVLAIVNQPTESATGWKEVFRDLKKRGVQEFGLVVADDLRGLGNALSSEFSGTHLQLCTLHLQRNIHKKVKRKDRFQISQDLKAIFRTSDSSYDASQGWEAWLDFCDRWSKKYPSFRKLKDEEGYRNYFTYLNYHVEVQSMIYTTNWIERLNRDYKRVTKMRGALTPDAAILLLGRVAMTKEAYNRKVPKLDYEDEKFKWEE
jgi:putative transposase